MSEEQCADGYVGDRRRDHAGLGLDGVLPPHYARDVGAESENELNDQQTEDRNGCTANGLDGGETHHTANRCPEKNKSRDASADQVWKKMHSAVAECSTEKEL